MSSLRVLFSTSYDPWFNLAVEDAIFKHMPANQNVLFLWRNDNTVVIGRAQNPWKECNTGKMAHDGIKLARRSSGGGAVFHDLGNTCFTFMADKPDYNKTVSTQIIIDALQSLNLNVMASGRNDLVLPTSDGDKKISGSAYKETMTKGFHHGTLLLNANLNRLADYLNPDPKKLNAKGIPSVKSRVTNLNIYQPNINHDIICQAIINAFFNHYNQNVEPEFISADNPPDMPEFTEIFAKQSSWQWNFGHAPSFSHQLEERFIWGGVEIHFDIADGLITQCQIFTDSLQTAPIEQLADHLINCQYQTNAIKQVIEKLKVNNDYFKNELAQLSDWLLDQIK